MRERPQNRRRYESENVTPWHLDKTFAIGVLITLLAQMASGIWAASKIDDQVQGNTRDITAMQLDMKESEKSRSEMSAHFASIDVTLTDMKNMMFQSSQRAMQLVMPPPQQIPQTPQVIMQQAPAPPESKERLQ